MNRRFLFIPCFLLLLLPACISHTPVVPDESSCVTPICDPCGCSPNTTANPEEQATMNAIRTLAWGTVVADVTELALSATPTSTASVTSTITPTRTPQPTSTLWRVEPSVTPVSRQHEWRLIVDQSTPPDFGLGKRYSSNDFSPEQKYTLHANLLMALQQSHFDTQVDTSFFFIWDALELDWDKDGQTETVLLYSLGQSPFARFGIAIVREEQVVALGPDLLMGEYPNHLIIRAIPLSRQKTALFVQLLTTTSGSGVYPHIYQRMYLWRKGQLQTIWNWEYNGGGRVGWASSWGNFEKVRFLHLSGQPELDLLISRTSSQWAAYSNPGNYLFHAVQPPGELLFSWNENIQTYQLTHFYDGARLKRIRPADFIVHAARINNPLALDGRLYDWYQVEYIDALDGYGRENWSRSPGVYQVKAAFDDSYLYIFLQTAQKTRVWLGLDTDLEGDFDNDTLNEDDLLFEIELSKAEPPACGLTKAVLVSPRREKIEAVTRPWEKWDAFCGIEVRIPLNWLELKSPLVPQPGYALRPRLHSEYDRPYSDKVFTEYYPRSGMLIGFAVIGENRAVEQMPRMGMDFLPFQPKNPATWGTLFFIADR